MRINKYTIEWDRKAAKAFHAIKDKKLQGHVLNALENIIALNPIIGKPLVGVFKGVYSYRIGVIRILYKHYKDRLVIVVLDIAHRREVYK